MTRNLVYIILALLLSPFSTYARPVIIAVIDTGADINHSSLKNSLWNSEDGQGFGNSPHGRDFSDSGGIQDNNGHGTHIAALISSGSKQIKLMILKYYDSEKQKKDSMSSSIEALRFALKNKVDIVNYSGGGSIYSEEEYKIISEMQKKGILFVAAAGNESRDIDNNGFYPASYNLSNIISVAAIDQIGRPIKSSNHGARKVHISALGNKIWSALPQDRFGPLTGTSQATAIVTRTAAVLIANSENQLTPEEIKSRLMNTGEPNILLKNQNIAEASLSPQRAIRMKDRHDRILRRIVNLNSRHGIEQNQ